MKILPKFYLVHIQSTGSFRIVLGVGRSPISFMDTIKKELKLTKRNTVRVIILEQSWFKQFAVMVIPYYKYRGKEKWQEVKI